MQSVDYVIVGGGSTGCVVASRLSENQSCEVALLEEGPRDRNPYIHIPGAYYKTAQGPLLKRYEWEARPEQQRPERETMVQARVLGGGSSVNAMIYIRGNPQDYDGWASAGAEGWSYEDVLPYFRKSESNNRFAGETHGTDGPLKVSDIDSIHPLTRAWLQACQQQGLPFNPDFNSGTQAGTGLYQITSRGRRRSSAAVAYLHPALARRNLQVKTGAQVTRVIVENGRATGVEFLQGGKRRVLMAREEVILSAGAVATPHLMMRSGLGPADVLQRHGIAVQQDLPGVGQNLQDHIEISLVYQLNGPHSYDRYKKLHWKALAGLEYLMFGKGPAVSNLIEGGAFWWGDKSEALPDCQFFLVCGAGIEEGVDGVPGGNGCTVNLGQVRPYSRGEVTLRSGDSEAAPIIRPNYFGDPRDLEAVTDATLFAMDVMEQPAISRFVERRHVPDATRSTRDSIRQFCQREAHAALHPCGTARIGKDNMAVVDPSLRVHGVDGLRVADASVMPNIVSGNLNAVCMMIGEKAADLMS
ncbi:GMC family oxidoreductase N-terminal domain-containing protein [Yangia mangrovi]|uniref:Alanine-phosphoribitol ligase n=1 Tax=Alloyangia mangrovi TaxID=1779329 RepID=A0A2A3K0A8_9RHOB|nr:GMC family oxidoreductase N-terminal domain-containing protein [Alloyangia mangrovi]MCT4371593.1 GMC family oxidoreductase N-terminal domain-containing protein [Alloyangia mangrovi]